MNKPLLIITMIAASLRAAGAERGFDIQKVRISKIDGTVTVRRSAAGEWSALSPGTTVTMGTELQTGKNGTVQIGLDPAITVNLGEQSRLILSKLYVNHDRKVIRSELHLSQGVAVTVMPSYAAYNVLFTMETKCCFAYLRNAVMKIISRNDTTSIEVLQGSVRVRNRESGTETELQANQSTVVTPGSRNFPIRRLASPAAPPSADTTERRRSIAMLTIKSRVVSDEDMHPLSDFIAQEIERQSEITVFFLDDVRAMLRADGMGDLVECASDSCLSLVGKSLGVDWVVIGRLGKIGAKYLFSLNMVDALRDRTQVRVSATIDQDLGKVLDTIPGLVGNIVEETESRGPPGTAKPGAEAVSRAIAGRGAPENMVLVPAGSFMMGSDSGSGKFDEWPRHRVSLDAFFMDQYEVTKADFERVMGYNPSGFKGCRLCPVDNVSWNEARDYCVKTGKRLPTEAEWEYACRAGSDTEFHFGNVLSGNDANFDARKPYGGVPKGIFRRKVLPIASFKPNGWYLYDMHGNVAEWCADWYDPSWYSSSPDGNPAGPKEGKFKVMRGGAWTQAGEELRSARRAAYQPSLRFNFFGFRCVKDIEE